jgi:hypothetical protein
MIGTEELQVILAITNSVMNTLTVVALAYIAAVYGRHNGR